MPKQDSKNKNYITSFGMLVSTFVLIYGIVARIQHWPYGTELIVIGVISIGLIYIVRLLKKKIKVRSDYLQLLFFISFIVSVVAHLYQFDYLYIFKSVALATLGLWLSSIGSKRSSNKSSKYSKIGSYSYKIAAALIVGGLIFRLFHLPGSAILILLGFAAAIVWFVSDMIFKE